MPIIRCQVVMPHQNGVPRDTRINDFHFLTAGAEPTQGQMNNISGALYSFYNDGGPESASLATYIANSTDRSAVHVRFYNMSEPAPRVPIFIETSFQWTENGSDQMPDEVAVCGSYRGALEAGVNMARRRGHVKLGPIGLNGQTNTAANESRPSLDLREAVQFAFTQIISSADNAIDGVPIGDEFTYVVYSAGARDNSVNGGKKPWDAGYVHPRNRPLLPVLTTPIVHTWCDDAFDTLRSRGIAPTGRLTQTLG